MNDRGAEQITQIVINDFFLVRIKDVYPIVK
jgi:hypothetical protein